MTTRTCDHGILMHRKCKICDAYADGLRARQKALYFHLMEVAGKETQVIAIRRFLRKRMRITGIDQKKDAPIKAIPIRKTKRAC